MPKPDLSAIPQFYHNYVKLVIENDALPALEKTQEDVLNFLNSIPGDKWDYRYAESKWSIKEVLQHMIDTERIFSYRALCFSRGEKASLPGFDENDYAAAAEAHRRRTDDLLNEFNIVRSGTILLFGSFSDVQLEKTGIANNNPVSVNSIGYISVGHVLHHQNILRERYLV